MKPSVKPKPSSVSPRTLAAVLVALPTLAFVGARLISGKGPAEAGAQTMSGDRGAITFPSGRRTPEQAELAHVMTDQAGQTFGPTPLRARPIEQPPLPDPVPTKPIKPEPEKPKPPELVVTSVLTTRGQNMAVVQGRTRKVGDVVAPGWTITDINAEEGTVTITHPEGDPTTFKLRGSKP